MILQGNSVVVATHNPGKVKEFTALFKPLHKEVLSLLDFPNLAEVEEDGNTFIENAVKKAKTIALQLNIPVLADDSGLCVNALNGAPGIYSARYAGEPTNAAKNNQKLLDELLLRAAAGYKPQLDGFMLNRGLLSAAQFVCALVLFNPQTEQLISVQGECPGYIVNEPRGQQGFGYDPLFYLPQYGRTMAELSTEQKNEISHRADAMKQLMNAFG
ncbi:MAG TPA: XTP/dITP diphosphatase [Bacilli bacterium]